MKINKGQFRLNSKQKLFEFELKRGKGHLFAYIKNRIKWHLNPRLHKISKFPSHVDIELSSLCNLNCPMCYTTTDEFKEKVDQQIMSFELFRKIIDECSQYNLFSIRLSFRGEAFLNKHIFDMIKYAKDKGIKEISTLTHGGFLTEEKFQKLINLKLDWLTISFDGIGETYEKIRHPLKFDDAVNKIRRFNEMKEEQHVVKPVIKVQTVWPAIADDPEKFYNIFNSITDQIASNPLIDYLHNDKDIIYEKDFTCPQLWQRLVIGSNGKVQLCSNDEFELNIIGNVNDESLYSIWHGENMTKAREIHLKHQGVNSLEPCKHCYLPRKTQRESSRLDNRLINIDNYVNRKQEVGK